MKFGLQDATIKKINKLLLYPQVEQATLYGSRAAGNFRNGSDIDLTLYGEVLTFNTLKKIIDDLNNLFLPYTIDLSIFSNISDPDIIDHIQRVGVTFYKRKQEQVNAFSTQSRVCHTEQSEVSIMCAQHGRNLGGAIPPVS